MGETKKTLFTVARLVIVMALLFAGAPETTPTVPFGVMPVSASALSGEGCETNEGWWCEYTGFCEGSHVGAWCDGEAADVCNDYCDFIYGTFYVDHDCSLLDDEECHMICTCSPIG